MEWIALLGCICIVAAFALPFIIWALKGRKRRLLLEAVQRTEKLRHERFKLEGEAHQLEQELPKSYRNPDADRSPTEPNGLILSEKARQAHKRRGEIIKRLSALDKEIKKIMGDELPPDDS